MTLAEEIKKARIDDIIDDQEFVEEENSFIRDYCEERNFDLSDEDRKEISNRGMDDALEFWEDEWRKER